MYSFASCNAWMDTTLNLPFKNLGLTPEGLLAHKKARDFLNANAEEGATVVLPDELKLIIWSKDVFRDDLVLTLESSVYPYYRITDTPSPQEEVIFTTEVYPKTMVVHRK